MVIKLMLVLFGVSLLLALVGHSSGIRNDSCIKSPLDYDGDEISNDFEENGIDINEDNITDVNLSNSSNPLHKDIFLELDYMENHRPNQTGMVNVVRAFENAPVCNPDGLDGINLHLSIDDMIPHKDRTSIECSESRSIFADPGTKNDNWTEIDNIKKNYFGTKDDRNSQNFNNIYHAKDLIYHYGVFIHQINNIADSGCAHDKEKMFVVSLGNESWWQLEDVIGKDPSTNDTRSNSEFEARSLMHELGHTLGLVHGGNSKLNDLNYKPNYLSIMNYLYMFPDSKMKDISFLDYSRCALPDINEVLTNYSQGVGIGNCRNSINQSSIWVGHHEYNNSTATCLPDTMVQFNNPINWSGNRIPGTIYTDINCDGRDKDVLMGFNDWENLDYLRK